LNSEITPRHSKNKIHKEQEERVQRMKVTGTKTENIENQKTNERTGKEEAK